MNYQYEFSHLLENANFNLKPLIAFNFLGIIVQEKDESQILADFEVVALRIEGTGFVKLFIGPSSETWY